MAGVRAQAECLISKLRQTGDGVAAANRRRGFAVREEGRWAREREAVMVGRRREKGGEAGHVPPRLGGQGHQLVGDAAKAPLTLEGSELIELIHN